MNRTNRSNFTSLSFTVEDDLISEASVSTYIADRKFQKNPFSQNYQIKGLNNNNSVFGQQNLVNNNKQVQKIRQQAQHDAYKQLNNDMYNPFEHKLQTNFIPHQQNLYQKQKQRQIQLLKRRQQEQLNNNKNYTILFNNNQDKKINNTLKMAANNVLNGNEDKFSIQDYYNKNIMPKKQNMREIQEEDGAESGEDDHLQKPRTIKSTNGPKNSISINLKQNNKQNRAENIVKNKPASIQKPRTSKQIKKPVNNFISTSNNNIPSSNNITRKPQQNSKASNYKDIPKNIPKNPMKQPEKKPLVNINSNKQKKKYSEVYEGTDRALVEQIQNQVAQQTNVTFQDIAELQNAKSLLQEAVVLPRMMPQFFKGIRKAMKGILMFGPPGTGKTLLAKAVANDNMFFNVSASSLASKWKGQSQKMVRILFQIARYHSPSIIFFDQIDAIASKRSQNEHQSSRKVKTQLLVQMDGVQSSQHQVFVLAATNRPWDLDQALRRRLQKRIYIPLPEKMARRKMLQINLKDIKLSQKINWERIVRQTEGYSGADISNVCRDAAYMPMRRMVAKVGIKKMAQINQKQLLDEQLSEKDLSQAIKNNKPSVNMDDLKKYDKWMKQFGSQ